MESLLRTLFLVSLLLGTTVRVPVYGSVVLYPFDAALFCFLLFSFPRTTGVVRMRGILVSSWIAFLGVGLLSLILNSTRVPVNEWIAGSGYLIRIAFYSLLVPVVIKSNESSAWVKRLYWLGMGFAVLGLIQFAMYPNLRNLEYLGWDPHYYRLFSTLLDPNFTGAVLVLTFFAGFAFSGKTQRNLLMPVAQSVVLLALVLTRSRSSILALLLPLFWYVLYSRNWRYLLVAGVVLAGAFFAPVPFAQVTPMTRSVSGVARMTNWSKSVQLIARAPLFGYGFNLLRSLRTTEDADGSLSWKSHAAAGADNSILVILLTTGIAGLAVFLRLAYGVARLGMQLLSGKQQWIGVVFSLSFLSIAVHALFNNTLFYPWIFFWMCILLGTGMSSTDKKNINRG